MHDSRLLVQRLLANEGSARDFIKGTAEVNDYVVSYKNIEGGFNEEMGRSRLLPQAKQMFAKAFADISRGGGEWNLFLRQRNPKKTLARINYSNYDKELVYQIRNGADPIQACKENNQRLRAEWELSSRTVKIVKPTGPEVPGFLSGTTRPSFTDEQAARYLEVYKELRDNITATHRPGCLCELCNGREPFVYPIWSKHGPDAKKRPPL
jgi:hypothetical protein